MQNKFNTAESSILYFLNTYDTYNTHEPPLSIRRHLLAQKFILKKEELNNHLLLSKICQLSSFNLTNQYWDRKSSPPLADAFISIANWNIQWILNNKLPFFETFFDVSYINQDVIIPNFTDINIVNTTILNGLLDGSKNDDGVGCAVWIPSLNVKQRFKCSKNVSIFSAECLAINKAIDFNYFI